MKDVINETFFSIVDLLYQKGLVKLEDYFLDGTKIEANANKYMFVWCKSTEKYDQKLEDGKSKTSRFLDKSSTTSIPALFVKRALKNYRGMGDYLCCPQLEKLGDHRPPNKEKGDNIWRWEEDSLRK